MITIYNNVGFVTLLTDYCLKVYGRDTTQTSHYTEFLFSKTLQLGKITEGIGLKHHITLNFCSTNFTMRYYSLVCCGCGPG